ncbi:MAG: fused MFS/spermidine synthase [Pseudomonadales bacterium]|nr:fused MFS/spermidine synthase [Pseudomonadales bacterium]
MPHHALRGMPIKCLLLGTMFSLSVLSEKADAQSNIIHEERSMYRNIAITEGNGRRCMLFNQHRGDRNQTCMDMADPRRLVFHYTRMSLAGLLLNPQPANILIAGLGGGSIPVAMHELFPEATIDVLEIDPAVVRVAEQFFNFREDDKLDVHVVDARVFIKRAALQGRQYDYIMLDAFTGEYIPEHLLTREFLEEVSQILSPDGVVVANTFSTSELYAHESVTYRAVFGEFYNFKLPVSGNRVIIAQKGGVPSRAGLSRTARELHERLEPFDVPILEYPARLSTAADWDESKRVLTDQYSPGNLLN